MSARAKLVSLWLVRGFRWLQIAFRFFENARHLSSAIFFRSKLYLPQAIRLVDVADRKFGSRMDALILIFGEYVQSHYFGDHLTL